MYRDDTCSWFMVRLSLVCGFLMYSATKRQCQESSLCLEGCWSLVYMPCAVVRKLERKRSTFVVIDISSLPPVSPPSPFRYPLSAISDSHAQGDSASEDNAEVNVFAAMDQDTSSSDNDNDNDNQNDNQNDGAGDAANSNGGDEDIDYDDSWQQVHSIVGSSMFDGVILDPNHITNAGPTGQRRLARARAEMAKWASRGIKPPLPKVGVIRRVLSGVWRGGEKRGGTQGQAEYRVD